MSRAAFTRTGQSLAACAAASLVASPILAQATNVGINAAVRNKVEIRSPATKKNGPAVLRARVFLADEVRTDAASQLQILLLDRSIFTVGAKARVTIDRFVYDPAENSRAIGINVAKGAFRFMSGRATGHPSGAATVRTPIATIGIRGTIFEGVVGEDAQRIAQAEPAVGKVKSDDDEASLIVLRGPGPRTQGDTIAGAIDVTAGDRMVTLDGPDLAVYAPRKGAPLIGPFRISAAGLLALQSLLRPLPAGGGGDGKHSHAGRNAALGVAGAAAAVIGVGLLTGGKKKKPRIQPNSTQQQPNGRKR
jgi:hypothetical protein